MGKKIAIIIAVLAVASVMNAAYWFRHDIADAYRRWRQGPLPAAVSYDKAQTDDGAAARAQLQKDLADRAAQATPSAAATDTAPAPADAPTDATTTDTASANATTGSADAEAQAAAELQKKKDAEIAALADMRSRIGDAYNLAVPFMVQAPFAVWDQLHDAACEEASAIMVKAFIDGETSIAPQTAEDRIQDLVAYEDRTFGYDLDTTAAETAQFMRDHMDLPNAKAVTITSMDDVRSYVSTGVPVILPAYGKALGNPYFRGEGPEYHMVVVRGFKDDLIIVNDPGTKRGEDFVYDADTLWNAVHDWNGGDVPNGRKVMIVPE